MQKKESSTSTYIILALIVAISLGLYFYFKGKPNDDAISSIDVAVSPESADAQIVTGRILGLLNDINSIRIDNSLFDSTVYRTLKDYTVTIPEQPVGRSNPFAPISGVSSGSGN